VNHPDKPVFPCTDCKHDYKALDEVPCVNCNRPRHDCFELVKAEPKPPLNTGVIMAKPQEGSD